MLRAIGSAAGTHALSSNGPERPLRHSVPIGSIAGVMTTWKSDEPPGTSTVVTRFAKSLLKSSKEETLTVGRCEVGSRVGRQPVVAAASSAAGTNSFAKVLLMLR